MLSFLKHSPVAVFSSSQELFTGLRRDPETKGTCHEGKAPSRLSAVMFGDFFPGPNYVCIGFS